MLKGFVERTLPDWSVKVHDLNLDIHERIFSAVARGPIANSSIEGPLKEIALSRAADVFRGKNDQEFYTRPDRYTVYGNLFLELIDQQTLDFTAAVKSAFLSEERMPPLIEEYAEIILKENPEAIGVSLCFSQQLWVALCLAKVLKRRTKAKIIFGGAHFTAEIDQFMDRFANVIDYIVEGEGEMALVKLLKGEDPASIPGVYFMSDMVHSSTPKFEPKIDIFGHPDFSDLDLRAYFSPEPVLPVLTSRGCYWRKCTFCVHYLSSGFSYRQHTVAHIVEQLQGYVKMGIRHFSFIDEMISPHAFKDLADGILKAGLDIHYYALAKPVKQFDRQLLEKIYASGCRYILWGMESANERVLGLIQKGTETENVELVFQTAQKVGIHNHVYIICGFPTETKEEWMETLRFLQKNGGAISSIHRSPFSLEKDSPIYKAPEKFSITKVWSLGDTITDGRFRFECSSGMTRDEMNDIFMKSMPFLRAFNVYSPRLGNFRDHALLLYAKHGRALDPSKRVLPPLPFEYAEAEVLISSLLQQDSLSL